QAEQRIRDAETKREALVAEAEADVVAKVAKAQAELGVQQERIKQVQQQLQADVVAPAEAQCKQAIAQAKGDAASIIEDGKAQAEGTQRLAESWQAAGANAKDVFLFQKLETLMKMMAAGVPEVEVESLTVIDAKEGGKVTQIASFIEQLRQTTGVDVAQVANNLTGNGKDQGIKKLEGEEDLL
ncbi:MAG: flotillin family protein, partial [Cyanobacteria bacterium J06633_1]